jgi:deazaflavin-dependent oxidoreductase (nitroreductase family)
VEAFPATTGSLGMAVEITPEGTRGRAFPRNPLVKALIALNKLVYRAFGLGARGMLLLTTVGSRSGEERTVPLATFPDGDDAWLIVASAGGDARHPLWFRNIARNPDKVWIQVGRRRLRVNPELLRGQERAERWKRITTERKNFADYQKTTDREIPVVRLTAV